MLIRLYTIDDLKTAWKCLLARSSLSAMDLSVLVPIQSTIKTIIPIHSLI
jgi:hypothetical protein